jgi:hypothetical protein
VRLFKDAMMDKSREAAGQMEKMNEMSGKGDMDLPPLATVADLMNLMNSEETP